MNDYTKKKLVNAGKLIILALCLALIIIGHKTVNLVSLGWMVLGLAGILILLYLYNRSQIKPNT